MVGWLLWLVVVVAVADVLLLLLMCVRWLYLCGGCGWLLVRFHCLAVWLVCLFGFAWACVGLCVLGGGEGVYASNASPCVRSKRFRVYRHQAHMFHTCGLGAGTHADVLNVYTGFFFTFFYRAATHQTHTTTTRHNKETETERERERETRQEGKTREETRQEGKTTEERR